MFNLKNKISIITGASSGIGRETAVLFSKLGSKLTLVGRNEKELDATISECLKNLNDKDVTLFYK
jgi:NADP-dependent 3-hydroxy acid dehydrogenase YdfG